MVKHFVERYNPVFFRALLLGIFLLPAVTLYGQYRFPGSGKLNDSRILSSESECLPALSSRIFQDTGAVRRSNRIARMTAMKSAIVPGWGQISNGQWWKVPIVYAAIGTGAFFLMDNRAKYITYRDAYRKRTDGDSTTIDRFDPRYGDATQIIPRAGSLKEAREFYKRYRDLSTIITIALYAANIVDAYVYAHLKDFDISDDLSLRINPPEITNIATRKEFLMGISLKWKP